MPMLYKHFELNEFVCNCGCGRNLIDEEFVFLLDRLRGVCGFPFFVTSGYRCPAHNLAVCSTSNNHVLGKAADIVIKSDRNRFDFIKNAIGLGFWRIGVYHSFIHVDIMQKPRALWISA